MVGPDENIDPDSDSWCMAQTSNSGRKLLLPPANRCPTFVSRATHRHLKMAALGNKTKVAQHFNSENITVTDTAAHLVHAANINCPQA